MFRRTIVPFSSWRKAVEKKYHIRYFRDAILKILKILYLQQQHPSQHYNKSSVFPFFTLTSTILCIALIKMYCGLKFSLEMKRKREKSFWVLIWVFFFTFQVLQGSYSENIYRCMGRACTSLLQRKAILVFLLPSINSCPVISKAAAFKHTIEKSSVWYKVHIKYV